ncbi:uncharacterized protein TRAVEDRAFT_58184 [Trametes versicolor FP-101664 SS1]|uniref:uncharacterized protein n=1 Tax=Trametes versicolor (strain FP-101664) TaxID=717944 RepID=UPI0004621597|nr:uncharacterized protein TRAVEDRAFT_58184 [Trametes versicolor FP-101664 SS1]EIW59275.1 hypothetical protein TRAVEDRAFT_58184 [Trametes versicolor FP-101664 SS1]
MSAVPTPSSSSGYASPAPSSNSPAPPKPNAPPKPKPLNVFSNDGSFLERFQRLKKEEDEKKKQEDTLRQKREFDSRFKKRGKRPSPDASSSNDTTENPAKKAKVDEPLNQYQKELQNYADKSLKEHGTGVRPLVK